MTRGIGATLSKISAVRRDRCALKTAMSSHSALITALDRPRPTKPLATIRNRPEVERRQAARYDLQPRQPSVRDMPD